MRCLSCNCVLNDREATRRGLSTNEFIDMCDNCYDTIRELVPAYSRDEGGDEGDSEDSLV